MSDQEQSQKRHLDQTTPRLVLPVDETDHARGPADAPVTLVWYGDYECDHCARAFPVVNELLATMGDRMRLVFRHFPQSSVHPHAAAAAQAAESAGAQRRFWAMHDLLFTEQEKLADADLTYYALKIPGLELYKFQADLASARFAPKVERDFQSGVKSGVKGTPTFFIKDLKYAGAVNVAGLIDAINAVKVD